MELSLGNSLMASDPRLIDHIVGEVKSQGIFDQFRKECLADVDTKPAYQNLRTRVESSVNSFLSKQTWRTDLNKNQLRETLRKHIHDAPYLEVGVERIVDQVVNPKIYSVFMPQVEDVVYKFLGIERPKPQRNGACDLKDLLPKDLDPVSPESDRNSFKDVLLDSADGNTNDMVNGNEQKPTTSTNLEEKTQNLENIPTQKECNEYEENLQTSVSSPVKVTLNSSFRSDDTNRTEEEEEESPDFEPIEAINLNESNMSNDSHLSGISELTSHRSQSPDFTTDFARDNFDCSNQDSQLSKVSSNSRLSIVTDFGSSNHTQTPTADSKDDSKYAKDNFKDVKELDLNKDSKFNFDVIKNKENSKTSNSSRENSRDASDYKESKSRDEFKPKSSKDKHDSRYNKDRDKDSKKRRSSKSSRHSSSSRSKDKNEFEVSETKDSPSKYRDSKVKEIEKKEDLSKEVKDLKDLYKEKIRELREKKELTEKEKLGKDKDSVKSVKDSKDKKDSSSSREKDDKRSHKSSSTSSSRSSSTHNKSSKGSEMKDSSERSSSRRDNRRHSNGKSSESRSSTKSKRDSRSEIKYDKSDSKSSHRSLKDKKRRDEKKSKPIDDHSSLRKNSHDRRSTDRDGSNGSSSKYSHKSSHGANAKSPSASLSVDHNRDHRSSGETSDNVQDATLVTFAKKVDVGTSEISLPLKKRPLHSDESSPEKSHTKKQKVDVKKSLRKKITNDSFKNDTDVASVPDEERVQIVEIKDDEYEEPYPEEPVLSLEETKKIILDVVHPSQSKLSEMEQSIRQSLNELMSDHRVTENATSSMILTKTPVVDSSSLLETLTDDSIESITADEANAQITDCSEMSTEQVGTRELKEQDLKEKPDSGNISEISKNEVVGTVNNLENVENIEKYIEESAKKIVDDVNKNLDVDKTEDGFEIGLERNMSNDEGNINLVDDDISVMHEIRSNAKEIEENVNNDEQEEGEEDEEEDKLIDDDISIINEARLNAKEIEENVNNDEQEEGEEDKEEIKLVDDDVSVINEARLNAKEFEENINDQEEEEEEEMKLIDDHISVLNEARLNAKKIEVNVSDVNEDQENSLDNVDECDENKLVIDEFDGKENGDLEMQVNVNKHDINIDALETLNKNPDIKKRELDVEGDKIPEEIVLDDDDDDDDNNDNDDDNNGDDHDYDDDDDIDDDKDNMSNIDEREKSVELIEDIGQERMKDQLIDELGKLNEDESDTEKQIDDEDIIDKPSEDEDIVEMPIENNSFENLDEGKEVNVLCNDDMKTRKVSVSDSQTMKEIEEISNKNNRVEIETSKDTIREENKSVSDIGENKDERNNETTCENNDSTVDKIINSTSKDIENDKGKVEEIMTMCNEGSAGIDYITTPEKEFETVVDFIDQNLEKEEIPDKKLGQEEFSDKEIERMNEIKECQEEKNKLLEQEQTKKDDELNEQEEIEKKVKNDSIQNKLSNTTASSDESSNISELTRVKMIVSPIEEDCFYLECDQEKYLSFKRFLDKVETEHTKNLECKIEEDNTIESFGTVVASVPIALPNRKRSLDPIPETIDSENNYSETAKENAVQEITHKAVLDTDTITIKKRKVGRPPSKKSNSTVTSSKVDESEKPIQASKQPKKLLQHQPKQKQVPEEQTKIVDQEIHQLLDSPQKLSPPIQQKQQKQQSPQQKQQSPQQQQLQLSVGSQQQVHTPMVNGENFSLPLSPDSDVSANYDKNSSNLSKEDRRSQRSTKPRSQRYSSDDLYKPRLLFPSSSRRTRRTHQA